MMTLLWIYLIAIVVTFVLCRIYCWQCGDEWHRFDRAVALLYSLIWPIFLPVLFVLMHGEHNENVKAELHSEKVEAEWELTRIDVDGNPISSFEDRLEVKKIKFWGGLECRKRQAINNRDKEWFQIIESILGFHPVSTTEALNKGIAKIRELRKQINPLDKIKKLVDKQEELENHKFETWGPGLCKLCGKSKVREVLSPKHKNIYVLMCHGFEIPVEILNSGEKECSLFIFNKELVKKISNVAAKALGLTPIAESKQSRPLTATEAIMAEEDKKVIGHLQKAANSVKTERDMSKRQIFMGNGDYSMARCHELTSDLHRAFNILSAIQQAPRAIDPEESCKQYENDVIDGRIELKIIAEKIVMGLTGQKIHIPWVKQKDE